MILIAPVARLQKMIGHAFRALGVNCAAHGY